MRVVLLVAAAAVACNLATGTALAADDQPDRPAPLGGQRLRVAALPVAAAVEWKGANPTGAVIDIWDELAGELGATTEFVRVDTFSHLIDTVRSGGDVDVALGPLAITEARERVVDLTHPIFHSGLRVVVRQRTTTGFLGALESLLSWQLVGLLAAVLGLAQQNFKKNNAIM